MIARPLAGCLAILAVLSFSGVAPAAVQTTAGVHHYYTELYPYPEGGFPTSATMDLTIRPDGAIFGYYHPTDGGVVPVSGSLAGERIALDIGGVNALHVNGKLEASGRIQGQAFRSFGRALFTFVGRPIPNDATLPRGTE
jgi:hypothetical protein